jgi:hypothetical protein
MVGGIVLSIVVIGIQISIWYFSDDQLQHWCEECAFGNNSRARKKEKCDGAT